jgi:hypothetical protein
MSRIKRGLTELEIAALCGGKNARKLMFTLEQIQSADDDMNGFCLACGHEQGCCEPDARRYECEACGEKQVYGASELVFMGRVK